MSNGRGCAPTCVVSLSSVTLSVSLWCLSLVSQHVNGANAHLSNLGEEVVYSESCKESVK